MPGAAPAVLAVRAFVAGWEAVLVLDFDLAM
jgi:hypothetical protein